MPFYFGLDLGQISDPSAAVILEAHGDGDERIYDCRHIEPYKLGTSYPTMVKAVQALLAREPLAGDCTLAIDHTGVGRPVFDMFEDVGVQPIGLTITGGTQWHKESWNQWHVSKIMLVGQVQRFLQSGRLRIGAKLPQAATLQKELRDFRVKISKAANETYDAREGAHDDLVLALAIALFVAEQPVARWLPVDDMHEAWREAGFTPRPPLRGLWSRRPF